MKSHKSEKFDDLVLQLVTRSAGDSLVALFEEFKNNSYRLGNQVKLLEKLLPYNVKDSVMEIVKRGSGEKMTTYIKNRPILEITMAFAPQFCFLDNIASKLYKELGYAVLLAVKVDPELIGGCSLCYKAFYRDYSIRERLNQLN